MMNTPRVSILMTVYNGERYLGEAVESLLGQTFTDFELLVVDDGSTDTSGAILERYAKDRRLRVLTNVENIGLTRSLNKALAAASGALIARQDADDRSLPHRLERQVQFMDGNPNIFLLGSDARIIDERGRLRRRRGVFRARTPLGVRWQMLFGNPFIHSAVMFRREVVADRLGGYDESFRFNQDFELWSRVVVEFDACNLPDVLLEHRTHAASIVGQRGDDAIESRRLNLHRNILVQRRNLATILADDALVEEWPPLWTAINVEWLTGPAQNPVRVLALIERMFRRFVELNPRAEHDADIAAQRSQLLWTLARYFARRDRRACAKALFTYFKHRHLTEKCV